MGHYFDSVQFKMEQRSVLMGTHWVPIISHTFEHAAENNRVMSTNGVYI